MGFTRKLLLASDISFVHCSYAWNIEGAWQGFPYYKPELYEELARTASRGVMDLLFFGDAADTPEAYGGSHHAAVQAGIQWPKHDSFPFVPLMAKAAPGVGFGLTMSTTYHHPFFVARLYNALDHVTGGRVAWNAVTSAYKNEAANWGYSEMMPHAQRYERAQEHMSVVRKLWNSVERDAIIMDKATGQFADPNKVHKIDHVGEYFNVPGPLPCMPSPQYHPVVVQAGQSVPGMDLCATHADLQFASRATVEGMRQHRKRLDDLLVSKGRNPRDVGIMWSLRVCPNESPEIVREKDEEWRASLPEGTGAVLLSSIYGVDFSKIDPQTPIRQVGEEARKHITHTGMFDEVFNAADPSLTLDSFGFNALTDHMTLAGSPSQIADQIEEIHEASNYCGGIIISTKARPVPGFLHDFVDYVVPELQRRGITKSKYEGATLRENLGIGL